MHNVANDTETAENDAENVRMRRVKVRTRNSPDTPPKSSDLSLPIDGKGAGDPKSLDRSRAETSGRSINGDRRGDDDGIGDTTSGGDVDSVRVEATLLAEGSQHIMRQG